MIKNNLVKGLFVGCIGLSLVACTPAYDPNLSPEQNKQNQRNVRYNQTLGEGALAGTALGALVGGLAGGGKGALIGSLSGAAVGTGAGYMVANRNQNQQINEDQLNQQIANAHQIAMAAQADAQKSSQEVAAAQNQLAKLNQQIAAKRISTTQYKRQISQIKQQSKTLQNKINYYSQQSQQMHQYAQLSQDSRMGQAAQTTDNAIDQLKQAENVLANGMGAQPVAYGQSQG